MNPFTIYLPSVDLAMLNTVFNGVAMICNQTNFIWGFALLAGFWRIWATTATNALYPEANNINTQGTISAFMALVLAMFLTTPSFKTTVTLENSTTGAVSQVDNVPMVIALPSAAATYLGFNMGSLVGTAYSSTLPSYASISSANAGFINPLKVLLMSRTAAYKLGSINSQINQVVSTCISQSAGYNIQNVISLVQQAGNQNGATSLTSIPVTAYSTGPTAIGALLYQASQNTSGIVPNFQDSSIPSNGVASCQQAAQIVANNISTALGTTEFGRVMQMAVSENDQLSPANPPTFTNMVTSLAAMEGISTVGDGGTTQANDELINLMFSEIVGNQLACLNADYSTKTTCQATMIQANEVERNNIMSAANANMAFKYIGYFGNMLLTLIIGLSPCIIMFMMFVGKDVGKNVKALVHLMVWPIIVTNVGAEIINGIIYSQVSTFIASIQAGGYLTQSTALAAYKEFSMQVGTASQLMGSLPGIMSLLFMLGGSSGITHIASKFSPSDGTADQISPRAQTPYSLRSVGSMERTEIGSGFATTKTTGALNPASSGTAFGQLVDEASNTHAAAVRREQSFSQGQQLVKNFTNSHGTNVADMVGNDETLQQVYRESLEKSQSASETKRKSNQDSVTKSNTNNTQASLSATGKVGTGGNGASASASAQTSTSATDTRSATDSTSTENQIQTSSAIRKAMEDTKSWALKHGYSKTQLSTLNNSLANIDTYSNTISNANSVSDTNSNSQRVSNNFVASASQQMTPEVLAHHALHDPYFQQQQLTTGRQWESTDGYADKAKIALSEMDENGLITKVSSSDRRAKEALVRTRAAELMYGDAAATPEQKEAAYNYLLSNAEAMRRMSLGEGGALPKVKADPVILEVANRTGGTLPGVTPAVRPTAPPPPKPTPKLTPTSTSTGNLPQIIPPERPSAFPQAEAFPKSVRGDINQTQNDVGQALANNKQAREDAGLVQGNDTATRTANGVVQNVKNIIEKPFNPDAKNKQIE